MSSDRDQVSRLLALAPNLQSRGGVPMSLVSEDIGL